MISKLSIFAINLVICFQTFGQICGTSVNNGVLSPTTSWQTVFQSEGSSYYWSFTGIRGKTYGFSLCEDYLNEDTEIRIYNSSFSKIADADNNGPYCMNSKASMNWKCQAPGTYYVQIMNLGCNPLAEISLFKYIQLQTETPTVSGLNPSFSKTNNRVSILGSNFGEVERVHFKTSFGISYTSGSIFKNLYQFNTPYNIVSGNLTLSGSFGLVETPYLTVTYDTPTIVGLNPNSTKINKSVSILGSNFGDVKIVYYKIGYETYSTFGSIYTNYYQFDVPNNIISGNLTLTGNFGSVITPYLTILFDTPTVTGFSMLESNNNNFPTNNGSLTGYDLNDIQGIIYNTYQGGTANTYPNIRNPNSFDFEFQSSLIYNTITLTGGFGNVVVDISQNVTRPTVSSINPSSSNTQNYVTIVGTNLQNVKSILFKTKTSTQSVSVRSTDPTKIEFLVPRNIVSGNLSLTGAYGLVSTPLLTINYLTPQFSSFYQNGNSISILGSNFNDVTDIKFINQFGVLEIYNPFFYTIERNLIKIYSSEILETGIITLSGGFGNTELPNFGTVYNSFNTNAINGGLITPTTVSQNLYLDKNKEYYYSFTGIAGLNYEFSLCLENSNYLDLSIYDNLKKMVSYKKGISYSCLDNNGTINFFCSESNNYFIYVDGLGENSTLSFIIPSKTSALTIDGVGMYNDLNFNPSYIIVTISGNGLNNVDGSFINTSNGKFYINSRKIFYNNNSKILELILPSNTVLNNLTLTGSFGTQVVNISTLGVEEPSFETQKSEVKIYPNPTDGIVHIESKQACHSIIYSIIGTKVYESTEKSTKHTIENIPSGIYIVDVCGTKKKLVVR